MYPQLRVAALGEATRLHKFKREFRALADVNHPNLVGLHSLEVDGGQWFFTMDLINGVDFYTYVRPDGDLDESRLRSTLAQLVTGVMALHAQHIAHRDLKPRNVMVADDGRVVILDFGLVVEMGKRIDLTATAGFQGTPAYAAPEQADGKKTPASDWYSVGVMLYEALAGRRPFNEPDPFRLLRENQQHDAPSIVGEENIPEDLASLCMQLLARDPEQRPDTLEIAKAISAGTVAQAPVPGADHPLVGRESQLAALKDAHDTFLKRREPLTVFVAGRSGEGKTSLTEQHLQPLRKDHRVTVLSGRCYDRESVPFKALDSLIDALASYLKSLPEARAALMLPDDIAILCQVFPALERVEVFANAPRPRLTGLDDQQVRTRAFAALRSLLWRIGERKPMIWFIDDLQWGDVDSADALFEVLRPPSAPAILFIGTYRSDEAETSRFLQTWETLQSKHGVDIERREVSVGPLSVEDCTELVRSLLSQSNETIDRRAAEFARETGGNPFLLIELVGCFDPATDSLRPLPMHEAIDQKLERLPQDARRLLEVVAVSGQAISLEENILRGGPGRDCHRHLHPHAQ